MFLPDYLLKGFDSTSIDNKKLVVQKREPFKTIIAGTKKYIFRHLSFSRFYSY